MYKKFNTIVKIVNIVISFYIKTSNENSNENSKKSVFFIFLSPTTQTTTISTNSAKKVLTLLNKYVYTVNKIKNNVLWSLNQKKRSSTGFVFGDS